MSTLDAHSKASKRKSNTCRAKLDKYSVPLKDAGSVQPCVSLGLIAENGREFAGRANSAVDWFEKLGYELPRGVNQADFFLDIASGDVHTHKINAEDARLHCISCAEKFLVDHPQGFQEGEHLSEANFGRELWYAAEVGILSLILGRA